MNELQFPGARWWKFDFHTHTPESVDFNHKKLSAEDWLRAFMEKEIDCVAITDHNSGDWVDILQQELKKIQANQPHWYRPLYLFPGVEISAHGGVHVLAIFGGNKNKSDIDNLLDAVDYEGTKGNSNGITTKSTTEVVNEIAERGGIPIPAHADKISGLFELTGLTLQQILENENINAMELWDSNYQKPQLYIDEKLQWAEIRGSDVHDFSKETFGTFTWVKMDEPSIEGLKLALQDGDVSVNCNMNDTPNDPPDYFIQSIEVDKAKYMGRSQPLNCRFSPFLNTIIGGRGRGKSTLLEFMRLALRRDKDIPGPLVRESRKYFEVGDTNLLIEDSKISLIYRKGEVRYRLNWSPTPDCPSLEVQKDDGTWESFDGEIKSLLPVRVYSQKQIFELAKEPSALIGIIDEAPKVDAAQLKTQKRDLENRYKQIEGKRRQLNDKIAEEIRLRGEFNDLERQIAQIEKSGHKEVLQNYRERQQQLSELEQQNIDPDRYPLLLAQQKNLKRELDLMSEHKSGLPKLKDEKQKMFVEIKENRKILSENRQKFLSDVLKDNQFVSIEVQPFGERWDAIEKEIRHGRLSL